MEWVGGVGWGGGGGSALAAEEQQGCSQAVQAPAHLDEGRRVAVVVVALGQAVLRHLRRAMCGVWVWVWEGACKGKGR